MTLTLSDLHKLFTLQVTSATPLTDTSPQVTNNRLDYFGRKFEAGDYELFCMIYESKQIVNIVPVSNHSLHQFIDKGFVLTDDTNPSIPAFSWALREVSSESDQLNEIKNFVQQYGTEEFKPFAFYDSVRDCIQIRTRDCSFIEDDIDRLVSVLKATHTEGNAGLVIHAVTSLCLTLGLPKDTPEILAKNIDRFIKENLK